MIIKGNSYASLTEVYTKYYKYECWLYKAKCGTIHAMTTIN